MTTTRPWSSNLIFVDCEAFGPCPSRGRLSEFGAVTFDDCENPADEEHHGLLLPEKKLTSRFMDEGRKALHSVDEGEFSARLIIIFTAFDEWLRSKVNGQPVFVSDNPAWDWQWITDGFHRGIGRNPFGHSGRRIGDYYAGLVGNFRRTQEWKRLRATKHDHHPVHDARGNKEALKRLLAGER